MSLDYGLESYDNVGPHTLVVDNLEKDEARSNILRNKHATSHLARLRILTVSGNDILFIPP